MPGSLIWDAVKNGPLIVGLVLGLNLLTACLLFLALNRLLHKKAAAAVGAFIAGIGLAAGTLVLLELILFDQGRYQNPGIQGAFLLGGLLSAPLIAALILNTVTKVRQLLKKPVEKSDQK